MTSLQELFSTKKENILNIYITAGYPTLNDTVTIMQALEESGADIIELGMPYSDPLADGPTIQQSNQVALQNGMSITVLLEQLKNIRNTIHIPIVLMGYLNPLLQYGFEKFCKEIKASGVDALIIPDMPVVDYEKSYKTILKELNIDLIFLITPQTSEKRIRKIDALSSGFLYAVTSSSTTGQSQNFDAVTNYLQRLKAMSLKNPLLAGFGVKDKYTFDAVAQHCNGGIIGSAFIQSLHNTTDVVATTKAFVNGIRN